MPVQQADVASDVWEPIVIRLLTIVGTAHTIELASRDDAGDPDSDMRFWIRLWEQYQDRIEAP